MNKLLVWEDIVKETHCNPRDPFATVISAVEELPEFSDITGTRYTQLQAVNIAYVISHRTGKFGLVIQEWNRMPEIQKTLLRFKQFFGTAHRDQ